MIKVLAGNGEYATVTSAASFTYIKEMACYLHFLPIPSELQFLVFAFRKHTSLARKFNFGLFSKWHSINDMDNILKRHYLSRDLPCEVNNNLHKKLIPSAGEKPLTYWEFKPALLLYILLETCAVIVLGFELYIGRFRVETEKSIYVANRSSNQIDIRPNRRRSSVMNLISSVW